MLANTVQLQCQVVEATEPAVGAFVNYAAGLRYRLNLNRDTTCPRSLTLPALLRYRLNTNSDAFYSKLTVRGGGDTIFK